MDAAHGIGMIRYFHHRNALREFHHNAKFSDRVLDCERLFEPLGAGGLFLLYRPRGNTRRAEVLFAPSARSFLGADINRKQFTM
jgi:hypothetical protein